MAVNTLAADKANAITLGVNWILMPNARINASWVQTEFNRLGTTPILSNKIQNIFVTRFTLQFF